MLLPLAQIWRSNPEDSEKVALYTAPTTFPTVYRNIGEPQPDPYIPTFL